ncbi:MAG: hypothetical protein AB1758_30270, partial [Candidatus Eremiobacterota bacterium]
MTRSVLALLILLWLAAPARPEGPNFVPSVLDVTVQVTPSPLQEGEVARLAWTIRNLSNGPVVLLDCVLASNSPALSLDRPLLDAPLGYDERLLEGQHLVLVTLGQRPRYRGE